MLTFDKLYGRIVLQLRGKYPVVGWSMTPGEAVSFIRGFRKTVLTFIGFSVNYEDQKGVLEIVKEELSKHSPDSTLVNIGATRGGVGITYPLAKSMGFLTTGIISTEAFAFYNDISEHVDHICFIKDRLWGGYMPGSTELSPTSRAMVDCSDFLVGIGGNEVARDELLAGRDLGKPVQFFPAEMNHAWAIRSAQKSGKPPPTSFFGSAHEVFGKDQIISTSSSQTQG
ncbi:MAG TPA: hypothetical protein VMJ90_03620 [Anaerolineales bacterium]|nr:hypothetical protein [Anaerolineales bacterium]